MSLYSALTQVLAPFAAKIKGIQTGYDGTEYNSPGEAVRGQINDLHVLIGDEPGTAIQASAIAYNGTNVAAELTGVNGRLAQQREDILELQEGGYVADQQKIEEKIGTWLDDHPEATTSVEDGSLTYKKMVTGTFDFVTPEMYGAKGDGIADDTSALQDAINNNTIVFGNGVYKIVGLNIPSNKYVYLNRIIYVKEANENAISLNFGLYKTTSTDIDIADVSQWVDDYTDVSNAAVIISGRQNVFKFNTLESTENNVYGIFVGGSQLVDRNTIEGKYINGFSVGVGICASDNEGIQYNHLNVSNIHATKTAVLICNTGLKSWANENSVEDTTFSAPVGIDIFGTPNSADKNSSGNKLVRSGFEGVTNYSCRIFGAKYTKIADFRSEEASDKNIVIRNSSSIFIDSTSYVKYDNFNIDQSNGSVYYNGAIWKSGQLYTINGRIYPVFEAVSFDYEEITPSYVNCTLKAGEVYKNSKEVNVRCRITYNGETSTTFKNVIQSLPRPKNSAINHIAVLCINVATLSYEYAFVAGDAIQIKPTQGADYMINVSYITN